MVLGRKGRGFICDWCLGMPAAQNLFRNRNMMFVRAAGSVHSRIARDSIVRETFSRIFSTDHALTAHFATSGRNSIAIRRIKFGRRRV